MGVPILRQPVKVRATQTSFASNSNNEIIFQLPNDTFYDARRGYLTFDANVSATGGTYVRLSEGIWSIFYRMRTLVGFELENIQEYNRLTSMLWESTNDARQSSAVGRGLMGIGTPTERNILASGTAHYACPVFSGLFDQEVLPLSLFENICELRMTLGDASTFVETDGTAPIVTISNVQFHLERIVSSSAFIAERKSAILQNGLDLGFATYNYYSQTIPIGTSSLQSLTINHKTASVRKLISLITAQNSVNDTTVNDKFLTWPKITYQHQFRMNNRLIPEEPVVYQDTYAAEAFFNYLNTHNKWNFSGDLTFSPAPISAEQFSLGNRFMMIVDVNGYPYDPNVINPVGNDNTAIQMQLDIYITTPTAVAYRVDSFVMYHRQIRLNPDRTIDVRF
jgi:hypothetical protein